MFCFETLYEKYKEDVNIGRVYLYDHINDLLKMAWKKCNVLFATNKILDFKNHVFLKLDGILVSWRTISPFSVLDAVSLYISDHINPFMRIPKSSMKKYNEEYKETELSWIEISWEDEWIKQIKDWITMTAINTLMEKCLDADETLVLNIRFFSPTQYEKRKNKYLRQKLDISPRELCEIEARALKKLRTYLDG